MARNAVAEVAGADEMRIGGGGGGVKFDLELGSWKGCRKSWMDGWTDGWEPPQSTRRPHPARTIPHKQLGGCGGLTPLELLVIVDNCHSNLAPIMAMKTRLKLKNTHQLSFDILGGFYLSRGTTNS